ncbi:MAG: hypothetical protein IKZ54_11090 [Bacteroidales bacterium]|jgi:hypothetical protein|nr:hypothetical protein [Bacteroidales bacterium]
MTENQFDELWQRAEAENYSQLLAKEYPAWRRKQNRIATVVTSLVVVLAVAVSLFTIQQRQIRTYEKVYCNRVGTADAQWATLAAEMLME